MRVIFDFVTLFEGCGVELQIHLPLDLLNNESSYLDLVMTKVIQ